MPMDKKTTPLKINLSTDTDSRKTKPVVSEKTLSVIRSFAAAYYVDNNLPKGLQGILLS
jgi:hypothetical protein